MTSIVCTVTAYCACTICCGPNAQFMTASGARPVEGITIACNWLPMGSVVRIEGFRKQKVVQDRMAMRFGDRIDIYYRRHEDALRFGKKKLKVQVVWTPRRKR